MILACPTCSARFLINSAAIGPEGREVRCGRCNHSWFATQSDDAADSAAAPAPESSPQSSPVEADPAPQPSTDGDTGIEGEIGAGIDGGIQADIGAGIGAGIGTDIGRDIDGGPPPLYEPRMHAEGASRPKARGGGTNLPAVRSTPRRWPARLAWVALIAVLIGAGAVASIYRDQVIAALPAAEPLYAAIGMEAKPLGFGLSLIIVSSDQAEQDGKPVLLVSGRIENTTRTTIVVPGLRASLFDAQERELQHWAIAAPVTNLPPNQNASFKTELVEPAKDAVRLSIVFHETR